MDSTTQVILDEQLHHAVTLYDRRYIRDPASIVTLLDQGANPNYVEFGWNSSAVEHAAQIGAGQLIQLMLQHSKVPLNFDARPQCMHKAPLARLLSYPREMVSDALCITAYEGMTHPLGADSSLLYDAIVNARYEIVKVLIRNKHALHLNGYYHACGVASRHDQATAVEIAYLLFDNGYTQTGYWSHSDYALCVHPTTALEVAARMRCKPLCHMLSNFAIVTRRALEHLANTIDNIETVTAIVERVDLRTMPDATLHHEPHDTAATTVDYSASSLMTVIDAYIHRVPAIPLVMRYIPSVDAGAPGPSLSIRMLGWFKTRIVIAFLKRGETPHISMRALPALHAALQPWTPTTPPEYYSASFHKGVVNFLIAAHLFDDPYLPTEMRYAIIINMTHITPIA